MIDIGSQERALDVVAPAPVPFQPEISPQHLESAGWGRRRLLQAGLAIGAAVGLRRAVAPYDAKIPYGLNWLLTKGFVPEDPLSLEGITDPAIRATTTLYNSLITDFDVVGFGTTSGLFLEENRDRSTRYAMNWPFGRAVEALEVSRTLPGALGEACERRYQDARAALGEYWQPGDTGHEAGMLPGVRELKEGPIQRYIDDNLWIGLGDMVEYRKSGDKAALARAEQTYKLAISQWDHAHGGGIRWVQDLPGELIRGRVMVSNAPAVMLGVELFEATGKHIYFDGANQRTFADIYEWIQTNLRDPQTGLYFDNKNENGDIGKTIWTYCQGTMVGAMHAMNRIDPNKHPMRPTVDFAIASLDYFDQKDRNLRAAKKDQIPDGYEDNAFNGIYFAHLLKLADESGDHAFIARVESTLLERVTRLTTAYGTLLQQAGALHLAALLAHRRLSRLRGVLTLFDE